MEPELNYILEQAESHHFEEEENFIESDENIFN